MELESWVKKNTFLFFYAIDSFLDVRCENGELSEGK